MKAGGSAFVHGREDVGQRLVELAFEIEIALAGGGDLLVDAQALAIDPQQLGAMLIGQDPARARRRTPAHEGDVVMDMQLVHDEPGGERDVLAVEQLAGVDHVDHGLQPARRRVHEAARHR